MNAIIDITLPLLQVSIVQKLPLERLIHNWLHYILDSHIVVIWAQQNSPRPELPYASLFINLFSSVGQPYHGDSDDYGNVKIESNTEFMLMIEAYGQSSLQIINNIKDALNTPDKVQVLNDYGIVYVDDEGVKNTSLQVDNQWEKRANLDIKLRLNKTITYQPGYFDKVNINGNDIP